MFTKKKYVGQKSFKPVNLLTKNHKYKNHVLILNLNDNLESKPNLKVI